MKIYGYINSLLDEPPFNAIVRVKLIFHRFVINTEYKRKHNQNIGFIGFVL